MILTFNNMIKLVFSLCSSVVKSVVSCCWLQEELVDGVQGYRDLCTILCTASYRLNLPHQWTVNILSYLWELNQLINVWTFQNYLWCSDYWSWYHVNISTTYKWWRNVLLHNKYNLWEGSQPDWTFKSKVEDEKWFKIQFKMINSEKWV